MLNLDLKSKYENLDMAKALEKSQFKDDIVSVIYGYHKEVDESIYFLTGNIDTDSYSFKTFAPAKSINPSVINMRDLLISIHLIRANNNGCKVDINFYKTRCFYDNDKLKGQEILHHLKNKDLLEDFYNVIIKDSLKVLDRPYTFEHDKDGKCFIIATNETLSEYMDREFGQIIKNKLIFLIPILGQIIFMIYVYFLIKCIFTKNIFKRI